MTFQEADPFDKDTFRLPRQHMPKKPKTVANTGIERFKGARNTNNQTLLPTNYAIF